MGRKLSYCLDWLIQEEQQGHLVASSSLEMYLGRPRRQLASKSCFGHIAPATIHWNSPKAEQCPYHQLYSPFIPVPNIMTSPGSAGVVCQLMTEESTWRNNSTKTTRVVSDPLPPLSPDPGWHVSLGFMGVMASGLLQWVLDTLPLKNPQRAMRRKKGTKETGGMQDTTGAVYYGY